MSDDLSLDARLLRFRSDVGAEEGPALAEELLAAARPREALEVLSRGLAARQDDPVLLRLAARALLDDGDALRAQQTLTRVIRANPEDVEAYRLLSEALRARGDAGRAEAAMAKVRALTPAIDEPAAGAPVPRTAPEPRLPEQSPPAPAVVPESVAAPATRSGDAGGVAETDASVTPSSGEGTSRAAAREASAARVSAPGASVLSEREELQQDVAALLAQAMKTASSRPDAPEGGAAPVSVPRPSAVPRVPTTGGGAPAPLDGVPSSASVASAQPAGPSAVAAAQPPSAPSAGAPTPAARAQAPASAAPVPAVASRPATSPAAVAPPRAAPQHSAPPAPGGAAAAGARPKPRRSPTLLGFAPPRPPPRPASVAPPPNAAPLPAIRPPSVRPPALTPSSGPIVAPPSAHDGLPPAEAKAPQPLPTQQVGATVADEDDEPTSFMDRESLGDALAAARSPAPAPPRAATSAVSVGGPGASPAAASGPLADTLPEFVVSNADVPAPSAFSKAASPKVEEARDAARPPSATRDVSAGPPSGADQAASPSANVGGDSAGLEGDPGSEGAELQPPDAAPQAANTPPRRAGLLLVLALLTGLAGGAGAYAAGVLPPSWSAFLDQRLAAVRGGSSAQPGPSQPAPEATATPPESTPNAVVPTPSEPEGPNAPAADYLAQLAVGVVPTGLDGAAPAGVSEAEWLAIRAEAALLSATPWWALAVDDAASATLAELLSTVRGQLEQGSPGEHVLRTTAIRLRAASGDAEVLPEARALAEAHPDDPSARWALAEALIAHGDMDEADGLLAELLAAGPELQKARVAVQRAWLAHQRGRVQDERAALEGALQLAPAWRLARLRALDLRLDAGEYRAVLDELDALGEQAEEVMPEQTLRRLRATLGLEEFEQAEALWGQLPESARERPDAWQVSAQFYLMRGEPEAAVRVLAEPAAQESADPTVIALYADALYEAGQTLVASAQYERAIALDGSHPEALIGFAQVLLRARKYREARVNLDRAEAGLRDRVRPPATLARLRVMRARIMVEERELQQAAVVLRRTLEIPGAPSEGWFYLGEALSRSNSPEARAAYERYLSLHPAGPLAARARRAIQ